MKSVKRRTAIVLPLTRISKEKDRRPEVCTHFSSEEWGPLGRKKKGQLEV